MFSSADRILALVLGTCFALVCVLMVISWHWRIPDWQDLPSARLNVLFHGGRATPSIETAATATASDTTQIPIFQELYERELLHKFPPSRTLTLDQLALLPGLAHTKSFDVWEGTPAMSRHMVPQGIALSDEWIFISAYDGAYQANSVLYMIDKHTGKLAKTIVLPGQPHAGGLAYDPRVDRLWIATHKGKAAHLASVNLARLIAYKPEDNKPLVYDTQQRIASPPRASFVEYEAGSLYVGYFDVAGPGMLCRYRLTWGGELLEESAANPTETWEIPPRAQGVGLTDTKLFVSQSYGVASSRLYVYARQKTRTVPNDPVVHALFTSAEDVAVAGGERMQMADKGADLLHDFAEKISDRGEKTLGNAEMISRSAEKVLENAQKDSSSGSVNSPTPSLRSLNPQALDTAKKSAERVVQQARQVQSETSPYYRDYLAELRMPPMMEDISVKDGMLYAVYESGATIYREKYGVGIDRVVAYPLEVILEQAGVTRDETDATSNDETTTTQGDE